MKYSGCINGLIYVWKFANLLKNAVDTAVKRVYVQIKRINQTLLAVVKNDYTVKPVVKEGK